MDAPGGGCKRMPAVSAGDGSWPAAGQQWVSHLPTQLPAGDAPFTPSNEPKTNPNQCRTGAQQPCASCEEQQDQCTTTALHPRTHLRQQGATQAARDARAHSQPPLELRGWIQRAAHHDRTPAKGVRWPGGSGRSLPVLKGHARRQRRCGSAGVGARGAECERVAAFVVAEGCWERSGQLLAVADPTDCKHTPQQTNTLAHCPPAAVCNTPLLLVVYNQNCNREWASHLHFPIDHRSHVLRAGVGRSSVNERFDCDVL